MYSNGSHTDEFEPLRTREVKDQKYLSKSMINAYLDDNLKLSEKKTFEALVGKYPELQQELSKKIQIRDFIKELIPTSEFSARRQSSIKREISDISDSILGDDKTTFKEKIVNLLDTTILEF